MGLGWCWGVGEAGGREEEGTLGGGGEGGGAGEGRNLIRTLQWGRGVFIGQRGLCIY